LPQIGRASSVKVARSWLRETRDHSSEQPFVLSKRIRPPVVVRIRDAKLRFIVL